MSEIENDTRKGLWSTAPYTFKEIAWILGVNQTQAYRLVQGGLSKAYESVTPYEFTSGPLTSGWSRLICDIRKGGSL